MIAVEAEIERLTGEPAAPSVVVSLEELREISRRKKPEAKKVSIPAWNAEVYVRKPITVGEILTLEEAADKLSLAQQAGNRIPPGYESVFYDLAAAFLVDANGNRLVETEESKQTLRDLPGMGILELFQHIAAMQKDLSDKVEDEKGN